MKSCLLIRYNKKNSRFSKSYLTQFKGKIKQDFLTDKGRRLAEETVARIYEAESRSFASCTEEKVNMHVRLLEKYVESFHAQLQVLQQDTAP